MHLQSQFIRFDEAIKLDYHGESKQLREKRDRVLTRLRSSLPFKFTTFNQGSYEMRTGIHPVDNDYDIDVGVELDLSSQPDPVTVKTQVFDAVQSHTSRVEFRRNCVTVFYQEAGEAKFHVDLAIYWAHPNGNLYLAVGKQHSAQNQRAWQLSEPKRLIELINNRHTGTDRDQFRRVIRALKRWASHNFASQGYATPRGIALTACALQWFQPETGPLSYLQPGPQYHDLKALHGVVTSMLNASGWSRLSVRLPVQPGSDLFERMTDQQMAEFKGRLTTLKTALENASRQPESTACQTLRGVFGNAFPVS